MSKKQIPVASFNWMLVLSVLLVPVLTGCSSLRGANQGTAQEAARMQTDRLYLCAAPYPRLYVEVDAVEGCEPPAETLESLRQFLSQYCNKPGGIEVARGSLISRASARGLTAYTLSRMFMKGPPSSGTNAPTAFLYVLYYDDSLYPKYPPPISGLRPAPESGEVKAVFPRRLPRALPFTQVEGYPAIFINTRHWLPRYRNAVLRHEAGHALGLAQREDNAANGHCTVPHCLMNPRAHGGKWLEGRLCAKCEAELQERLKELPPENLHFIGRVLVRRGDGYSVLSLPNRYALLIGEAEPHQCERFVAETQREAFNHEDFPGWSRTYDYLDEVGSSIPQAVSNGLAKAESDPSPRVRAAATNAWMIATVEHFKHLHDYATMMSSLQQLTELNPDNWAFLNSKAWWKATCPDAALRDGKKALAWARRACEMAGWQESSALDTLAAAYAECGDFEEAQRLEVQALRTGSIPQDATRGMRARLEMYGRREAYREMTP